MLLSFMFYKNFLSHPAVQSYVRRKTRKHTLHILPGKACVCTPRTTTETISNCMSRVNSGISIENSTTPHRLFCQTPSLRQVQPFPSHPLVQNQFWRQRDRSFS